MFTDSSVVQLSEALIFRLKRVNSGTRSTRRVICATPTLSFRSGSNDTGMQAGRSRSSYVAVSAT